MKTCRLFTIFCAACSFITVGVGQPREGHAGFFPDVYWALFGPPGTPYFAGYSGYYRGGGYYAGYAPRSRVVYRRAYRTSYYSAPGYWNSYYGGGYTTYYGGGYTTYGSGCARPARTYYVPASRCQPCPTACDPCAVGGPCQISPAPGASNGNRPRTFKKPEGGSDGNGTNGGKNPPVPGKDDSEFKSRDDTKKFKATPEEKRKKNESPFKLPGNNGNSNDDSDASGDGTGTQHKTLKPQVDDKNSSGPIIKKNKPAPPKPPVDDDKNDERSGPQIDLPNLDGKITWKPAVRRTRQVIRPVIVRRRLVRSAVDPNAGWKPVSRRDVELVKK